MSNSHRALPNADRRYRGFKGDVACLHVLCLNMFKVRNKLKLQGKMKFIVEQTMRAHKGSKVVVLLFNLGVRWRW